MIAIGTRQRASARSPILAAIECTENALLAQFDYLFTVVACVAFQDLLSFARVTLRSRGAT